MDKKGALEELRLEIWSFVHWSHTIINTCILYTNYGSSHNEKEQSVCPQGAYALGRNN